MNDVPVFDPNQPFSEVSDTPVFDPNSSYEEVDYNPDLNEKDALEIEVAKGEYDNKTKKIESNRDETNTEAIDLALKKAKLDYMNIEDTVVMKNKQPPTEGTPYVPKTFAEQQEEFKEAIIAPFKDGSELALNLLEELGTTIGGTIEDAYNYVTGNDISYYDEQRKRVINEGKDLDIRIDPDGKAILKPTETTMIMASTLPATQSIKALTAIEGGLGYSTGYKNEGSIKEGLQQGAIQATASAVVGSVVKKVGDKYFGELSNEAQLLIKHNGIQESDALKLVEGVAKEDQVYALARNLEVNAEDYIAKAVMDSPEIATALRKNMQQNTIDLQNTMGDTKASLKIAKDGYNEMIVEAKNIKANIDIDKLTKELDFIEKINVAPSKANSIAVKMKGIIDEGDLNIADVLEFRSDVNAIISKTKKGKELSKLHDIKNQIDETIESSVVKTDDKKVIYEAIDNYKVAKNNEKMENLIAKHTNKKGVTNWYKLKEALKKEPEFNSPESKKAVTIIEEFSKKYGNDIDVFGASKQKGSGDVGGALGTMSYIIGKAKDTFALYGHRSDSLKIQSSIIKSIRRNKTYNDFIDDIQLDKTIPKEFKETLSNTELVPYGDDLVTNKNRQWTAGNNQRRSTSSSQKELADNRDVIDVEVSELKQIGNKVDWVDKGGARTTRTTKPKKNDNYDQQVADTRSNGRPEVMELPLKEKKGQNLVDALLKEDKPETMLTSMINKVNSTEYKQVKSAFIKKREAGKKGAITRAKNQKRKEADIAVNKARGEEKQIQNQIKNIRKDNPDSMSYDGYDGSLETIGKADYNKLKKLTSKKNLNSDDNALINKYQDFWDQQNFGSMKAKQVDDFEANYNPKQQEIDMLEESIYDIWNTLNDGVDF